MFGVGSFGLTTFAGLQDAISLKQLTVVSEFAYSIANIFNKQTEHSYHVFTYLNKTTTSSYTVYKYLGKVLISSYEVRTSLSINTEISYRVYNEFNLVKEVAWSVDPRQFPYIYNNKTKDTPDKELDYLLKDTIKISENEKIVVENSKPVKARRKGTVKL